MANPDDKIKMPNKERPNYKVLSPEDTDPESTWQDPTKPSEKVKEKIDKLKKGVSGIL